MSGEEKEGLWSKNDRSSGLWIGFSLPVLGGLIFVVVTLCQVFRVLAIFGQSLLENIVLSSTVRYCISLYLSLGLSSLILSILGSYLLLRGLPKTSVKVFLLSTCLGLTSPLIPSMYGFDLHTDLMIANLFGAGLVASGSILAATTPSISTKYALLRRREAAAIALFSILHTIMMVFSWQIYPIPSPAGGLLHLDFAIFVAALLSGSKVGGLVGVFGSVMTDFYLAQPQWHVSVLAYGLGGAVSGLARGKPFPSQVVACTAGGMVTASVHFLVNIFLKGYPTATVALTQDLAGRTGISIILGLLVTEVVKRTLYRTQ